MKRVLNDRNTPLVRGQVAQLMMQVWDLDGTLARSPLHSESVETSALTDLCSADPAWTEDDIGYNLRVELPGLVTRSLNARRLRVELLIRLCAHGETGRDFQDLVVWWELSMVRTWSH
jgi:hypothetical protein